MLTLRQFRYLESLASHRHFGKAASACSVTQPALSQQLKELEGELGLILIERTPKQVTLTPDGHEVVRRASRILAETRDLADYAAQRAGVLHGPLRLGVIPSIAPYVLPRALNEIQQAFPRLDLRLRESQTETLTGELLTGQLDVLLLALPVAHREIETIPLFIDRFLLALNRDEAAAMNPTRQLRVHSSDVNSDRLLLLEEGHCLREQALKYCNIKSDQNLNNLGASSLTTIIEMIANGYGMTLLPEICARIEVRNERIALLRFDEPQPYRQIGLAWRRSSPRKEDFRLLGSVFTSAAQKT